MKRCHTATPRKSQSKNTTSPRKKQTGGAGGKRFLLVMLTFAAVLIIGWGQCSRTRVSGAAGSNNGAFNQGHNLRKLTVSSAAVYTIPVFPPNC